MFDLNVEMGINYKLFVYKNKSIVLNEPVSVAWTGTPIKFLPGEEADRSC